MNHFFNPNEKDYTVIPNTELRNELINDLAGSYPTAGLKYLRDYVKNNHSLEHPVLGNINALADEINNVWKAGGGYGDSFFALLVSNIKIPDIIPEQLVSGSIFLTS